MIEVDIETAYTMLYGSAMMAGYVVFTYFLEKFHGTWHEEEGKFTVCGLRSVI